MSDSDVIKEFLVALGFKVDDAKLKKFATGIDQATKFVGGLATGVEAMAVAVEAAVTKVSAKFEDLYYASQRIGDSVENVRGFAFAVGQVGGSAQGAMQALENMGEFFRSNPGAERFLQGLGVETRTASGQLRGMTEIVGALAVKLRAMPYYRAKVIANVLGIDPRTLQALRRGTEEAADWFHSAAQRMGVDQQKAAVASHAFMNDLRKFLAFLTLAADRIILKVQPLAEQFLNWLIALDEKTNGWSTTLIGLVAVLGPLLLLLDPIVAGVAALAAGIVALILDFEDWKRGSASFINWDAWADEIDAAMKACGDLGKAFGELIDALKPLGKWFVDVMGPGMSDVVHLFLDRTTAKIRTLADAIRVVADILQGDWKKAWQDARQWAVDDLQAKSGVSLPPPPGASRAAHDAAVAAGATPPASSADNRTPNGRQPLGIRNNNPGNLRTGPGSSFGRYATPLEGLTAMARNLQSYSRRGLNTIQAIITRWAPPSENDTAGYIRDVARELGVGARDRLNLQDPETLKKLMAAIVQHENGKNPYSGALMSSAAAQALGGRPGEVNQKTDIHVHGVSDPAAAGREVAGHQARVNDAMVRQLRTTAT